MAVTSVPSHCSHCTCGIAPRSGAVCACASERESERASERESARERERERERETERVGARAAALPQPLHMQGVGYRAYSDTA